VRISAARARTLCGRSRRAAASSSSASDRFDGIDACGAVAASRPGTCPSNDRPPSRRTPRSLASVVRPQLGWDRRRCSQLDCRIGPNSAVLPGLALALASMGERHSRRLLHRLAITRGCRTNPRRARQTVSNGGLRKQPSRPSRACRPSRGRRAWPLWGAFRERAAAFRDGLCDSLRPKQQSGLVAGLGAPTRGWTVEMDDDTAACAMGVSVGRVWFSRVA
jgi:hypothetical protein